MNRPNIRSYLLVLVTMASVCVLSTSADDGLVKRRRFLDTASDRELCNIMCSQKDWCPLSCPEHALMGSTFGKRNYRPFNDALGNLSFDDYLFLKMMGRTRK